MKYLCSIILIAALFFMSCAPKEATVIDANYAAYQSAMQLQLNREQKPLFDLTLDDQGRVKNIKMFAEQKVIAIKQYKAPVHPLWSTINKAIPVIGTVFGIIEGGKAIERIANSGGDTYTNSNNVDDNSNNAVTTSTATDNNSVNTDDNSVNTDDNSTTTDNNSINDSYNTDDNSINDSYNTDDNSVNTEDNSTIDNNSINDSYNTDDNSVNSE